MVAPAAKREAVAHLTAVYEMSERRACQVIEADRKTVRYKSRRPADAEVRRRLRELAARQRCSIVRGVSRRDRQRKPAEAFLKRSSRCLILLAPSSRV